MKNIKSYGSWITPITADKVASGTTGLHSISISSEQVFWLESRPSEDGRTVLVSLTSGGEKVDLTPENFDVRTRVHEYGGAPYLVVGEKVYFTNFDDQRVYELSRGNDPRPITPDNDCRYADFSYEEATGQLWAVCEDHSNDESKPNNYLVTISPANAAKEEVVVGGDDFYSSPRLSPDGSEIAWISWNHPNMPWDGTYLYRGSVDGKGGVTDSEVIAGAETESVVQPKWSPNGDLYFVSDRTGWWNIYRWSEAGVQQITDERAEFTGPRWQFGISSFDFPSPSELVVSYTRDGKWFLGEVDARGGEISSYKIPDTTISSVKANGSQVWYVGGAPETPASVRVYDRETGDVQTYKSSTTLEVDGGFISVPSSLKYESEEGEKVHAFYYAPTNKDFAGPDGEKPPLLVISHGGPTSATSDSLSPKIQYWTSRGIAVLDVNYRGSTGFGRNYREKLKGNWGIVDVEDCSRGARHLVKRGEVDGEKLIIRGGSAGGYTTLAALTFTDVFDAGASYYGVSDPTALAKDTHKFESRYLDSLIGPYPEERSLYEERSPIRHTDGISCPVIFFQGTEDKVVPPSQAEKMYKSLNRRGIATAYLAFEGEQHGFRKEENIRRALEAELFFYSRVFDFDLDEEIDPVEIKNLS
ncbi:MAG: prolyl oligopeptidase family serine peptidase [Candidatus Bipolaricaulia bacterium]